MDEKQDDLDKLKWSEKGGIYLLFYLGLNLVVSIYELLMDEQTDGEWIGWIIMFLIGLVFYFQIDKEKRKSFWVLDNSGDLRISYISIIVIVWIVYSFSDWIVQFNEVSYLQNRHGFVYEVNSDSKFTGSYVDYYGKETDKNNRKMKEKIIYRDGVRGGGYTFWYENGQEWTESRFYKGKKDGLYTEWNEDGDRIRNTWIKP